MIRLYHVLLYHIKLLDADVQDALHGALLLRCRDPCEHKVNSIGRVLYS